MAVYLDNAATSFPKPGEVYRVMDDFQRCIGASAGRGAYRRALQADEVLFTTRKLLGKLFNISDISRIVFTCNITESLNLALKGLLNQGDHVITSAMEHNAVWRTLKVLEKEKGISINVLPCPGGAAFDPHLLEDAVSAASRLVALTHASNVTGTLMPVRETGAFCRARGIPLLLDAAQTAGVYPVDVEELGVDLLAFTGHKGLLGPMGTGGLYIAPGIDLKPLKEGGTGGDSLLEHQPEHLPDRFEAGTLNVAGIAGLGAAVAYLLNEGVDRIRAHEVELTAYALRRLPEVAGITVYGPPRAEDRTAVISFNLRDIPPEETAYVLDEAYDIMVRAGLHCSPRAHRCIGTVDRGTVRISCGVFNRKEEIDLLLEALQEIVTCE